MWWGGEHVQLGVVSHGADLPFTVPLSVAGRSFLSPHHKCFSWITKASPSLLRTFLQINFYFPTLSHSDNTGATFSHKPSERGVTSL